MNFIDQRQRNKSKPIHSARALVSKLLTTLDNRIFNDNVKLITLTTVAQISSRQL